MKNIISIFFILCISVVIACKSDKQNSASSEQQNSYKEISIEEAKTLLASGDYTFIDIRTPGEIEETGKVEGALKIDFKASDFEDKLNELDKSDKYVIYCRSGGRSGMAMSTIKQMGFKEVHDMTDGFSNWK